MALDKFGVPIEGIERQMMSQPKRKDHFRVIFIGFGDASTSISLETNTVSQPQVSYEKHEVHAYNSKMHYKGKYTWSPIEVSMRDTIDNGPLIEVLKQAKREFDHEKQEARTSAGTYKFQMRIEQLDGSNSDDINAKAAVVNGWFLEGCLLEDIQYGDGLDYSTSEYGNITITVQPDNCSPLNDVTVDNDIVNDFRNQNKLG